MKLFPAINDDLAAWAQRQPVFFTGSASTHGSHVNVSPKGLSSTHFSILSPNLCAYIDRTGSGCETIAHSYENGRLCLLFISFGDTPRILRLFCRSSVIEWDQPAFEGWVRRVAGGKRDAFDGARAVIVCDIWQVQTSCGYGVPRVKKALYAPKDDDGEPVALSRDLEALLRQGSPAGNEASKLSELAVFEERPTMDNWAASKADGNAILDYQQLNNSASMDGLPGLRAARRGAGETLWVTDIKVRLRRIAAEREAVGVGFSAAVLLYFLLTFVSVL